MPSPLSSFNERCRSVALPVLFILLGMMFASWAARIPAVRDALRLSASDLGIALLSSGIGMVLAFPLASWLLARHGARHGAWFSGVGLLIVLPALALAPTLLWLMLAMFAMGAAASCFDVAINAIGAEAEKQAGRSIMARLHAWFCAGTLLGALAGSAMAALAVAPLAHFFGVALFFSLPLWCSYRVLPADQPATRDATFAFSLPHGKLIALGVLIFCGATIEGSIADWSGIYLIDVLHASDGMAPLAFAVFSIAMLFARLLGDRLKDRFGARRVVVIGAWLATIGIGLVISAGSVAVAFGGFALVGVGAAALFPFVFSAAGKLGPSALAGVATMGYSGGLIGPPVIGFLADWLGLSVALGFIGVLSMLVGMIAGRTRLLD